MKEQLEAFFFAFCKHFTERFQCGVRLEGPAQAVNMGSIIVLRNVLKSQLLQGCRHGQDRNQRKGGAAPCAFFQTTPGGCADTNFNQEPLWLLSVKTFTINNTNTEEHLESKWWNFWTFTQEVTGPLTRTVPRVRILKGDKILNLLHSALHAH